MTPIRTTARSARQIDTRQRHRTPLSTLQAMHKGNAHSERERMAQAFRERMDELNLTEEMATRRAGVSNKHQLLRLLSNPEQRSEQWWEEKTRMLSR